MGEFFLYGHVFFHFWMKVIILKIIERNVGISRKKETAPLVLTAMTNNLGKLSLRVASQSQGSFQNGTHALFSDFLNRKAFHLFPSFRNANSWPL